MLNSTEILPNSIKVLNGKYMVIGLISKGGKGCLLNLTKVLEAESKNIKVQFKGRVSDDVAIDMFDMCTIISNLLNNAIEACEKYKRTKE